MPAAPLSARTICLGLMTASLLASSCRGGARTASDSARATSDSTIAAWSEGPDLDANGDRRSLAQKCTPNGSTANQDWQGHMAPLTRTASGATTIVSRGNVIAHRLLGRWDSVRRFATNEIPVAFLNVYGSQYAKLPPGHYCITLQFNKATEPTADDLEDASLWTTRVYDVSTMTMVGAPNTVMRVAARTSHESDPEPVPGLARFEYHIPGSLLPPADSVAGPAGLRLLRDEDGVWLRCASGCCTLEMIA